MARRFLAAAAVVVCLCCTPTRAATPQQVDATVKKAVDWLYSKQKDGNWEQKPAADTSAKLHQADGGQWGGTTALATYALLAAGESPQHEKLAPAIDWLKKANLTGTYALALRGQVYSLLPSTPEIRGLAVKDATTLRAGLKTKGEATGFYDYTERGGNSYSHSRGNYGVLGMWALEQAGVEVPIEYWKIVEKGWIGHQDPAGGWRYTLKQHPLTPGMTAAGVATLFITQDYVNPGRGLNCIPSPQSPAIDKGLKWLEDNFARVATDESYDRDFPYATLYACERVGVASGLKYFGKVNWYQHGADWLIKKQVKNGSFSESGKGGSLVDTSFAVLFLARGRAPVIVNKLDYSGGGNGEQKVHWNMRPRDVARLVRWVGKSTERELQWQITNLTGAADDLHDAPILYLSGKDEWTPSDEAKTKIKAFIDAGGLALANADCMGKGFVASIRKLGSDMYPGYEFRELPENHPIYTEQQFHREKWKNKPGVLGLSNGVRELILLIPQADPAKVWQLGQTGGKEESWQLGANIVLYAVDKRGLRARGETHLVNRDEKKKPDKTIDVARLEYAGNWDPEPGGWRRLADVMHNAGVELKVKPAKATALGDAKMIHLTGTSSVPLDPAAQAALKKAIDGGATLVIDAAGGSAEFATAVEKLIPLIAKEPLKPLPVDHALYSAGGGGKLENVKFRDYAQRVVGSAKDPKLQAVERDGRAIVIYSREDLSAGMVGQPVDGVIGYDPPTSTALMSRILHYAAGAKK